MLVAMTTHTTGMCVVFVVVVCFVLFLFFCLFFWGDCVFEMKAGYLSLYACLLWQPMPKIGEGGVEREWGVT